MLKKLLLFLVILLFPLSAGAAGRETAGECQGYKKPAASGQVIITPPTIGKDSPEFEGPFLPEGSTPEITDDSYKSDNVVITISAFRYMESDVTVADIYIRKLDSLVRSYGGGKWNKKSAFLSELTAQVPGSILSMTGDSSGVFKNGLIIGNGIVWKNNQNRARDVGVLWKDGSFDVYTASQLRQAGIADRTDEIWCTFVFGPFLLSQADGSALSLRQLSETKVKPYNPRAVFGYYAPGHYCFVLVDGRKTPSRLEEGAINRGVRIEVLAELMESLGCRQAYNLDGGQSAELQFNGKILTTPYNGGRRIGDALVITDQNR